MQYSSTILIADDSLVSQQALAMLLSEEAYLLTFASDGIETIQKAEELLPDLILLDVLMPLMDGFDVCRRLRANPALAEVPIIMLSGLDDHASLVKGFEAGADDFIRKPFDRLELLMRVRSIIRINRYRHLLTARTKFERLIELSPDSILMVDTIGTILMANSATAQMLGIQDTDSIIGQKIVHFMHAAHVGYCMTQLNRVVNEFPSGLRFEVDLQRSDHTLVPVEIHAGYVLWDNHRTVQMIARDITERREDTRKLQQAHQAEEERADRFRMLIEMGRDLVSVRGLNALLQLALQRATTLSGYDSGSIILLNDPSGSLEVQASYGNDKVNPGTVVQNLHQSVSGWVMQQQQPLILEDLGKSAGTEWRYYTKYIPSTVTLPLIAPNGNPIGVLSLKSTHKPRVLSADDLDALQLFASFLAVVIENSRLNEENGRLVQELSHREYTLLDLVERLMISQEEERRRVAYELHDGLAQVAVSAYQHLQTFASHYRSRSQKNRQQLNRALELSQRIVKESRQVIAGLRPTVLDDFGLVSALRHEANNLRSEGWEISCEDMPIIDRLSPTIETAFFRVAQEALNNVRKHAGTTHVRMSLQINDQTIRLEVQDWGRGFQPHDSPSETGSGERIGLIGMQERMALLGGTCRIHSHLGAGTIVIAEAPLTPLKEKERELSHE